MVREFSAKINVMDFDLVLQYSTAAQKNAAAFSQVALESVRSKNLGEVGETLSALVVELKEFCEEEEKKVFFGLFKKSGNKLEIMKAQFTKIETNVEK